MRTEPDRSRRRRTKTGVSLGVLLGALGGVLVALPAAAQGQPAGLSNEASQIACAVRAVREAPTNTPHLISSTLPERQSFGPGDTLVVDAGADKGLAVNQEFFVRRVLLPMDRSGAKEPWVYIRTAGWLRIVEVHPTNSLAKVVFACDAFDKGDLLEPFELPAVPKAIDPPGQPDYSAPGVVLLGEDRRATAGTHFYIAVDRGSDHGLKPGQRVTIFRRIGTAEGVVNAFAEGTTVLVMAESSVVRVDRALQAIFAGDLVALHR